MPIIKSAKKRVRQAAKRRVRNFAVRAKLRETIKGFVALVKDNKPKEAEAALPGLQKVIDMAAKKNIIHDKNASRKKSRFQKMLSKLQGYKAA